MTTRQLWHQHHRAMRIIKREAIKEHTRALFELAVFGRVEVNLKRLARRVESYL